MKLSQFVPFGLSLSLFVGIYLGFYFPINTCYLFLICLTLFVSLVLLYFFNATRKNPFFTILTLVLFIGIGMLSFRLANPLNHQRHYTNSLQEEKEYYIHLKLYEELKPTNKYFKYKAKILHLNDTVSNGLVLLNLRKTEFNSFSLDDEFYAFSKFYSLPKPKNINEFDYGAYLEKNKIFHQLYIQNHQLIAINNPQKTLKGFAFQFRNKIMNSLQKYSFNKNELAIINALLLGQRQDMSKDLIIDYQKAGAVHLLAVSGLHVSVILALLFLVTKPLQRLKKGKLFSSIFVLIGLWFFAFIAGLSPSVVRAVTMFSIISIGLFLSKKTETLHSVFISMFLLLLISPYFAFSVGFQLSYLAVISILLIYPLINKIYTPKNKIIRFFWDIILVSISAQIGVLPLSLYYFHQFPSLFFVSSVVIIPFLGLILGLGILIMFLAVFKILPVWLADLYQLIIEKMNDFIHFIAEQESFLFTNISFSYFKVWISYLLILSIIFLLYKKKVKYVYLTLLVFIGFQLVNLNEKYLSQKTDELVVFDKFKHTLIANKIGNNVSFFISDSSLNNNLSIINYLLTHHKLQVKKQVFIPNIIPLKENNLLIIDSLGVYKHDLFKNGIILLRQTPKINLERLITNYQPKQIIADASNYKSAILQWKKTCYKYAVPFYDTNNQGAFKISY